MDNSTENLPTGKRVIHLGTQERGTVTTTSTDALGTLATVDWDDPEALELPRTLHAKHLDVVVGIESVSDDELVAECHRRGLPGTVNELCQEAKRQGILPSELMERLDGAYDGVMSK